MTKDDLIAFEKDIAECFERGEIKGPVHLSGGNEDQLIEIFKEIKPTDWCFSNWRSHYHALLKGVPPAEVKRQIMEGRSMFIYSHEHRFYASSIMGGCLPIACGVASTGHGVWCFIGDMCASTGHYSDARRFADHRNLDLHIIIEDNGLATNTPTENAWGRMRSTVDVRCYGYQRTYPHYQPLSHGPKGF